VTALEGVGRQLLAQALAYPEAAEDWPWGERVVKVRGKIFAFLAFGPDTLSLTVKLPASRDFALMFEPCAPTGYGLGKSGWVSCRLGPAGGFDTGLLAGWVDESYRAVAPKRLVKACLPGPAE
jgi:predicted DNA-binding protein (MmcQ/YjbR family)